MSWDAWLVDDRGHTDGEWNYTHNCNGMIELALGDAVEATAAPWWADLGAGGGIGRRSWWDLLDGKSGPEGAELLDHVIRSLEAEPETYVAMNPENGWGDYDGLLKVLRDMCRSVPEWPTRWKVWG
jgi:hypothetical protein